MIPGLKGVVYLMGDVLANGYSDKNIDLALTDMRDKKTIETFNKNTKLNGRFNFIKLSQWQKPEGKYQVLARGKIPNGGIEKQPIKLFHVAPVHEASKKIISMDSALKTKTLLNMLPEGMLWSIVPNYMGIRCQLHKDGKKILILSNETSKKNVKPIIKDAESLPYKCIIDGIIPVSRTLSFICLDTLLVGSETLTDLSLEERNSRLPSKNIGHIIPAERVSFVKKKDVLDEIKKINCPTGIIIRAMDADYWSNNSTYKVFNIKKAVKKKKAGGASVSKKKRLNKVKSQVS